jgi:hypothetical protein
MRVQLVLRGGAARCIGRTKKGTGGASEALRHYEGLGQGKATIVRRSRLLGRIGQLEDPVLCWLRNLAFKAVPSRAQARQFVIKRELREEFADRIASRWE